MPKPSFAKEQLWYYLTYARGIREFSAFQIIARLESELANNDVVVQQVIPYATRTSLIPFVSAKFSYEIIVHYRLFLYQGEMYSFYWILSIFQFVLACTVKSNLSVFKRSLLIFMIVHFYGRLLLIILINSISYIYNLSTYIYIYIYI